MRDYLPINLSYSHGPLARTEIGDLNVQGIDYAYTIHGWLKTMNSESMVASNDAGEDGKAGSIHSQSARDAAGFSLLYYDNDYKKIGTGQNILASRTSSNYNGFTNDLYNGNIKAMATALPDKNDYINSSIITPKSQVMLYTYDQLNRIKQSQSIVLNTGTNEWGNSTANPAYQSDYAYDYNGNILYLNRLESGVSMDQLTYEYAQSGDNNRLHLVRDLASSLAFTYDIDNQELPVPNQFNPNITATWNYQYDEIGNMISDKSEGITEIKWTVSGKIASIDWNGTKNLAFLYDASGQRVMKQLVNGATTTTTWYIRDASGNVMSTYSENAGALQLDETYIYGSSRIGSYNANLVLGQSTGGNDPIQMVEYFRGQIVYELSNHLGNVLAVITDRKIGSRLSGPGNWEHFEVDYKSFSDYYPYGMLMDGRSMSSSNYRWSFNGKENDIDISARGNCFDYGFRIYNSSIARFLSVDPLTMSYPNLTPYQFADNMPICAIDLDGLEAVIKINSVTVSETFLKIQSENGTEQALSYLKDNWMNTVHSKNGMSWIGTITNGKVDPQVIRKAEVLGLPGILVVYTLEMTGARTAKFVENRYVLPDNRSWQEKFKDKLKRIGNVISGWFSSDQPRKKYMADWFQEWLNSRGAYEQLDDSKEILGLGLRPVTQDVIEFENRQSDNSPFIGPKLEAKKEEKVDSVDTEYATLWKQDMDTCYPIETETKRATKHANGESRPIKREKK